MIDIDAFRRKEICYKPTSLRAEDKLAEELTGYGYHIQKERYYEKYPMSLIYKSFMDFGVSLYGSNVDAIEYGGTKIILYNYNNYVVDLV